MKVGLMLVFLLMLLAWQALASRPPLYGVPANRPSVLSVDRDSLLVELEWTGLRDGRERFARVPEFTLYADGTAIFRHQGPPREKVDVLVAHLSRTEADSVCRHILALGFAHLESHTACHEKLPGGRISQTFDASNSVIRVRMPSDTLRVIENCADYANDPAALKRVRTFLREWHVPGAHRYTPVKATLVVVLRRPPRPVEARAYPSWPLTSEFLASEPAPGLPSAGYGERVDRAFVIGDEQYGALLKTGNLGLSGVMFFTHGGWVYEVVVRPWLPGEDFTSDVRSYRPME